MEKKQSQRACPVCQNITGVRLLHAQKFKLPDKHPLPEKYDVVTCDACGFVYADTSVGQDVYDKYYAEMSKYETSYINSDTALFTERASWLSSFVYDKAQAIVDVGAGNGQLLVELQKMGCTDLTAIDPSQKCIDYIRSIGINGLATSIFDLPIIKRFDASILSGVLEHIYDVPKIIHSLTLLTKENGYIFVFVPDASRYQDYDQVPFDYFNIEHINHFDEISLINLGLIHGLRLVSMYKTEIILPSTKQPVIFCAYRNEGAVPTSWLNYSSSCILTYIQNTQSKDDSAEIIDCLVESKKEIIVWGVGNMTSRLLATTNLAQCNITMFVDNDKNKQQSLYNGKYVCSPESITLNEEAIILIAAAVFHDEIVSQIRSIGLTNQTVILNNKR